MKISKKAIRIIAIVVAVAVVATVVPIVLITSLSGSGSRKDSIVIMTEDVSGLFNPFYATTGADMSVVGLTQISMLSTDASGSPTWGDDEPTVVKDFDYKVNSDGDTVYTFVIKNGIKFSDGVPLTMNDVMFNIYEYLDPVYTGSSTMYSTKIKGLARYRTGENYASQEQSDAAQSKLSVDANGMASDRIYELVDIFTNEGKSGTGSYSYSETQMRDFIKNLDPDFDISDGYKKAVASEATPLTGEEYRAQLLADYEFALKTFREELQDDFKTAREAYDTTNETSPYYKWADLLKSDVFKFYLFEGKIKAEYEVVNGREDKNNIKRFTGNTDVEGVTEEAAINTVYNDTVKTKLHEVLSYWATAGKLQTKFAAEAMAILLHENDGEGGPKYTNIEGIVSLGHTTSETSVTVNGRQYTVAHEYNKTTGEVVNQNEYAVLRITIDGTDPKAVYSFGFAVAPAHYYTADAAHPNGRTIDIANDKFGVEYASPEFQTNVIQSEQHVGVPIGAGAFKATDTNNSDDPKPETFLNSNVIYFKSNDGFLLGKPKAEKIRFQVVSSANALDALENGQIDYATPQFTPANSRRLEAMTKNGFGKLDAWQLGYGYIGINAGRVQNINLRKAIMSAMDTSLAVNYYESGTAEPIDWPMSMESWAYPWENKATRTSKQNGKDYTQWTDKGANVDDAKAKIDKYMKLSGIKKGDKQLEINFTIAGSSITEHPTYSVFKKAAEILNSMDEWGFKIEVKPDSQALTKLATGSLSVWAAAWGSSLDPDMYQVYHKNSTATSVYAWGYREIKSAPDTTYKTEWGIITELSEVIDDARLKLEREDRIPLYEEALGLVLDLAVEMPVYQRKNLYAYNAKTIKGINSNVNPYTSPFEKIWELELV